MLIGTVIIVTVVIVTLIIVTVVKVVIVTPLSKDNLTHDNRCDVRRAAFCDSRDVYKTLLGSSKLETYLWTFTLNVHFI